MNILKIMGPWRLKHILLIDCSIQMVCSTHAVDQNSSHVIASTVKRETAVKPPPHKKQNTCSSMPSTGFIHLTTGSGKSLKAKNSYWDKSTFLF